MSKTQSIFTTGSSDLTFTLFLWKTFCGLGSFLVNLNSEEEILSNFHLLIIIEVSSIRPLLFITEVEWNEFALILAGHRRGCNEKKVIDGKKF